MVFSQRFKPYLVFRIVIVLLQHLVCCLITTFGLQHLVCCLMTTFGLSLACYNRLQLQCDAFHCLVLTLYSCDNNLDGQNIFNQLKILDFGRQYVEKLKL